eukprot:TRINITY_DN13637_c0_g1_i1.p1 TRINITY_DN13637_c0_g1~~TRINITY_DN13637_c0_g1_i1.p1  ORF type:complete len:407 (+),score=57.18 TRINITY_DN13637_c0_g1_i1:51-1271(+)
MSKNFLVEQIGLIVEQNTPKQGNPSVAAVKSLEHYLRHPIVASIVYSKVIERAQNIRKYSPTNYNSVLHHCLLLLKHNLFRYPPQPKVLGKLTQFLRWAIVDLNKTQDFSDGSRTLRESLVYLLCATSRIDNFSQNEDFPGGETALKQSVAFRNTSSRRRHRPVDLYQESCFIPENHFQRRLSTDKLPQGTVSVSPHVMHTGKNSKRRMLRVHYSPTPETLLSLQTINASKKSEEVKNWASTRRTVSLFHYKVYDQQSTLVLPGNTLQKILNVIVDPTCPIETQVLALKILIKVMMDIFCEDMEIGLKAVLSLLMDMVDPQKSELQSQPPKPQSEQILMNALDFIFNLSVHFNLFENSFVGAEKVNTKGISKLFEIQKTMFKLLNEVLVLLVHKEKKKKKKKSTLR